MFSRVEGGGRCARAPCFKRHDSSFTIIHNLHVNLYIGACAHCELAYNEKILVYTYIYLIYFFKRMSSIVVRLKPIA